MAKQWLAAVAPRDGSPCCSIASSAIAVTGACSPACAMPGVIPGSRASAAPRNDQLIGCDRFHGIGRLVRVALKPWRPGLPVRQPAVLIANRHLDLRQTLFVEDFVLRDHLVQEEQVGGQRIYLIGGESPLVPERHAAMDKIPHRRRERRAQWQYA